MVAPVPAEISNLRPCPPAAPLRRRSLPLLTTHYPLSTLFLSALCFHILTNCFSHNPFILTTIPIAPGCGGTSLQSPSELNAFGDSVANPLFSGICCLFPVSLRSFLRSLPLFSIACSLFSQNTGGGVSRMQLRDTRVGGSMTRYRLSTVGCELRSASTFAAVVGGGGDSHAAKFVEVILAIEDAPLFAVLEDLFFLRSDAFADFRVGFLFFFQRGGENLHDLLADGIAVFDEFHVVAGDQHIRNLMRQPNDFFPRQSHARMPGGVILRLPDEGSRRISAEKSGNTVGGSASITAAPACGRAPTALSPFCTSPGRTRRYAASRPGVVSKSRALRHSSGLRRSALPSCAAARAASPLPALCSQSGSLR